MDTTVSEKTSIFRLFRLLTGDIRTFMRQEIQLVKTELTEKISHMGGLLLRGKLRRCKQ
jgi:hypothetical protein